MVLYIGEQQDEAFVNEIARGITDEIRMITYVHTVSELAETAQAIPYSHLVVNIICIRENPDTLIKQLKYIQTRVNANLIIIASGLVADDPMIQSLYFAGIKDVIVTSWFPSIANECIKYISGAYQGTELLEEDGAETSKLDLKEIYQDDPVILRQLEELERERCKEQIPKDNATVKLSPEELYPCDRGLAEQVTEYEDSNRKEVQLAQSTTLYEQEGQGPYPSAMSDIYSEHTSCMQGMGEGYQSPPLYGTEEGYQSPPLCGTEGGYQSPPLYGTEGGYQSPPRYGTEGGYQSPPRYGTEGGYQSPPLQEQAGVQPSSMPDVPGKGEGIKKHHEIGKNRGKENRKKPKKAMVITASLCVILLISIAVPIACTIINRAKTEGRQKEEEEQSNQYEAGNEIEETPNQEEPVVVGAVQDEEDIEEELDEATDDIPVTLTPIEDEAEEAETESEETELPVEETEEPVTPLPTSEPEKTAAPSKSKQPEKTKKPVSTKAPQKTKAPEKTKAPKKTSTPKPTIIKIKSISLPNSAYIVKGGTYQIDMNYSPANATEGVSWSSSNSQIVSVSNGKLKAKKCGTATITVRSKSGVKKSCKVTVTEE